MKILANELGGPVLVSDKNKVVQVTTETRQILVTTESLKSIESAGQYLTLAEMIAAVGLEDGYTYIVSDQNEPFRYNASGGTVNDFTVYAAVGMTVGTVDRVWNKVECYDYWAGTITATLSEPGAGTVTENTTSLQKAINEHVRLGAVLRSPARPSGKVYHNALHGNWDGGPGGLNPGYPSQSSEQHQFRWHMGGKVGTLQINSAAYEGSVFESVQTDRPSLSISRGVYREVGGEVNTSLSLSGNPKYNSELLFGSFIGAQDSGVPVLNLQWWHRDAKWQHTHTRQTGQGDGIHMGQIYTTESNIGNFIEGWRTSGPESEAKWFKNCVGTGFQILNGREWFTGDEGYDDDQQEDEGTPGGIPAFAGVSVRNFSDGGFFGSRTYRDNDSRYDIIAIDGPAKKFTVRYRVRCQEDVAATTLRLREATQHDLVVGTVLTFPTGTFTLSQTYVRGAVFMEGTLSGTVIKNDYGVTPGDWTVAFAVGHRTNRGEHSGDATKYTVASSAFTGGDTEVVVQQTIVDESLGGVLAVTISRRLSNPLFTDFQAGNCRWGVTLGYFVEKAVFVNPFFEHNFFGNFRVGMGNTMGTVLSPKTGLFKQSDPDPASPLHKDPVTGRILRGYPITDITGDTITVDDYNLTDAAATLPCPYIVGSPLTIPSGDYAGDYTIETLTWNGTASVITTDETIPSGGLAFGYLMFGPEKRCSVMYLGFDDVNPSGREVDGISVIDGIYQINNFTQCIYAYGAAAADFGVGILGHHMVKGTTPDTEAFGISEGRYGWSLEGSHSLSTIVTPHVNTTLTEKVVGGDLVSMWLDNNAIRIGKKLYARQNIILRDGFPLTGYLTDDVTETPLIGSDSDKVVIGGDNAINTEIHHTDGVRVQVGDNNTQIFNNLLLQNTKAVVWKVEDDLMVLQNRKGIDMAVNVLRLGDIEQSGDIVRVLLRAAAQDYLRIQAPLGGAVNGATGMIVFVHDGASWVERSVRIVDIAGVDTLTLV